MAWVSVIQMGQAVFEPGNVCLDLRADPTGGRTEAVFLCGQHFHHLASARHQRVEFLGGGVGQRAQSGAHGFGKPSQNVRIDTIGLGQLARCFGKVSHLPWVDNNHGQSGRGQSARQRNLDSPGGLQHDQIWSQHSQSVHESGDAGIIARDGPALATGSQSHIESTFGDIDSYENRGRVHVVLLCSPTLRMRARMALATVRADAEMDMTTQLAHGLSRPEGNRSITSGLLDACTNHHRTLG